MDLEHQTSKFYKTEEERLESIRKYRDIIDQIEAKLQPLLIKYDSEYGLRFFIYEINNDRVHASLEPCCGQEKQVPPSIYKELDDFFNKNTPFKEIIWE